MSDVDPRAYSLNRSKWGLRLCYNRLPTVLMDDPASLVFFFQSSGSITPAEIVTELFLIFLIVALNGFFVASEFALVSVRRTRIEKLAAEGAKPAIAALRLLDQPTKFISAVQLGVTLASLALGVIGEPTIAKLLEP